MYTGIVLDIEYGQFAYNQPLIEKFYYKTETKTVKVNDGEDGETTVTKTESVKVFYNVTNTITNSTVKLQ